MIAVAVTVAGSGQQTPTPCLTFACSTMDVYLLEREKKVRAILTRLLSPVDCAPLTPYPNPRASQLHTMPKPDLYHPCPVFHTGECHNVSLDGVAGGIRRGMLYCCTPHPSQHDGLWCYMPVGLQHLLYILCLCVMLVCYLPCMSTPASMHPRLSMVLSRCTHTLHSLDW